MAAKKTKKPANHRSHKISIKELPKKKERKKEFAVCVSKNSLTKVTRTFFQSARYIPGTVTYNKMNLNSRNAFSSLSSPHKYFPLKVDDLFN